MSKFEHFLTENELHDMNQIYLYLWTKKICEFMKKNVYSLENWERK